MLKKFVTYNAVNFTVDYRYYYQNYAIVGNVPSPHHLNLNLIHLDILLWIYYLPDGDKRWHNIIERWIRRIWI